MERFGHGLVLLAAAVVVLIGLRLVADTITPFIIGGFVALLVLPLYVPVLIFGAGAVDAVRTGLTASAHLSLLGAGLLIAVVAAPLAAAAAVRIALD